NWLLRPEEAAEKDKIELLYQKLSTQSGRMAQAAEAVLGKEATLTQNVSNLNQNINFMNQLNETFTYVQIPLKLDGQNANGDLYVYTNKKSLAQKEGSVSAFLHLDMDHLGPVDCYVTMEEAKVSTNFKVADDETLDLIEEHLDLLNERLAAKGFTLHPSVAKLDEKTSVLEEMQRELGGNNVPISMTGFDARA
ncbi:MAG: flagellar hook-length control protein FliK, partial [Lachnospiraceae bacterium]|nr:flagellar hook-length control protein FliK [Lachnospiraceae bacterium]